jgi:hypothetical protein
MRSILKLLACLLLVSSLCRADCSTSVTKLFLSTQGGFTAGTHKLVSASGTEAADNTMKTAKTTSTWFQSVAGGSSTTTTTTDNTVLNNKGWNNDAQNVTLTGCTIPSGTWTYSDSMLDSSGSQTSAVISVHVYTKYGTPASSQQCNFTASVSMSTTATTRTASGTCPAIFIQPSAGGQGGGSVYVEVYYESGSTNSSTSVSATTTTNSLGTNDFITFPQAVNSCSNTAYGAFTCVQACNGAAAGVTSQGCAFGANVTSGNVIYVMYAAGTASTTLSLTGCAPVSAWTLGGAGTSMASITLAHAYGSTSSTAACTITANSTTTAAISIAAIEISGGSGGADGNALSSLGSIAAAGTATSSSITTGTSGDLIIGGFADADNAWVDLLAGTNYTQAWSVDTLGITIELRNQASAGSVTATAVMGTVSANMGAGILALTPPTSSCNHNLRLLGVGCS